MMDQKPIVPMLIALLPILLFSNVGHVEAAGFGLVVACSDTDGCETSADQMVDVHQHRFSRLDSWKNKGSKTCMEALHSTILMLDRGKTISITT